MGKAARAACIFTPWVLTIASLACLVLITVPGWSSKGILSDLYLFKANFTELNVMAPNLPSKDLTAALQDSAVNNKLARVYEVHLYNFCERNKVDKVVTWCSPKMANYHFDPLPIWSLNTARKHDAMTKEDEIKLLGEKGQKALDAYHAAALPLFISYQVSYWATLVTILCGISAVFSRWGSFATWLLSIVRLTPLSGHILVINRRDVGRVTLHRRRCTHQHGNLLRFRWCYE